MYLLYTVEPEYAFLLLNVCSGMYALPLVSLNI